ncbi:hypothetical protein AcV5_009464 [Taiwanofungus camphoratus]|nr:hypothetical protein AcV5_009464 [Antrodia cinnamomea]
MADYIPLTQEEDSEKDDRQLASRGFSVPFLRGHRLDTYSILLAVALFALLAVNIFCLSMTTHQLKMISQVLRMHLDYTDTRALPRPNQYDGLEVLSRN